MSKTLKARNENERNIDIFSLYHNDGKQNDVAKNKLFLPTSTSQPIPHIVNVSFKFMAFSFLLLYSPFFLVLNLIHWDDKINNHDKKHKADDGMLEMK